MIKASTIQLPDELEDQLLERAKKLNRKLSCGVSN